MASLLGHAALKAWPDFPREAQERLFANAVDDTGANMQKEGMFKDGMSKDGMSKDGMKNDSMSKDGMKK